MNLEIQLTNLRLERVFLLGTGSQLIKGGKKTNRAISEACLAVEDRFLCYYWKVGGIVTYVGSCSKDYHRGGERVTSNLHGRMFQYLQTHVEGRTNKNVFDAVNLSLTNKIVEFGRFIYDSLDLAGVSYSYEEASECGFLTLMIEHLLIGSHKSRGECEWNRPVLSEQDHRLVSSKRR